MLALFLALIIFFAAPRSASAQIPLLHQLFFAYTSDTLYNHANDNVLGVSDNNTPAAPLSSPTPSVFPTSKAITIALLGDSMIDTLGPKVPSLETSLAKYYPNIKFKILNYGVGSQNIESGLNRLTHGYDYRGQSFPPLVSTKPDIVVVESFAYNNFGQFQSGIDKHWLLLGAVTTTLKNELPQAKIVLASTIAPNSQVFANGVPGLYFSAAEKSEKTDTIRKYLQNTVNFAGSQKFPLADAYHPSLVGSDGNRSYINPADNIHPSPAGAAFFSDILAKTIFDNNLIN